MRIAHLILAHKNPSQLERLLSALSHPSADCFVHVDKKVNLQAFLPLREKERVFFIKNTVSVEWGAYSQIQATLNTMEEALAHADYGYLNLISGQDYPLVSSDALYQFLLTHYGAEFITCYRRSEGGAWWARCETRVSNYHFINWKIPGRFRIQRVANALLPQRKYPLDHELAGRSNWFTITGSAAAFILSFLREHPEVVRYFKYVWGADEFIFATVLVNSDFGKQIREGLQYVDWSQGKDRPKVLTDNDFDAMIASGKFFARKFDEELDTGILTRLEERVRVEGQDIFS